MSLTEEIYAPDELDREPEYAPEPPRNPPPAGRCSCEASLFRVKCPYCEELTRWNLRELEYWRSQGFPMETRAWKS